MTKSKQSIFVVDDVQANLQVVGNILKGKGLNISFARNGEQALLGIKKKKPDLILLDISMPEMDGYEVCERLLADDQLSEIPVIFLTARTQTEDIVKGFRVGAVDYVTKPFNPEELLARVFTHLELKLARDTIKSQNLELKELNKTLKAKNEELYRLSVTDKLTGVYNRLYLMDALSKEFARSHRHHMDLSCIILDIDHFKKFNDTYGHQVGDDVLVQTAQLVKSLLRQEDYFGRYGGEEFLLILPDIDISGALKVAEKVRETIEEARYSIDILRLSVTVSLGISDIRSGDIRSGEALVHNADLALYEAKKTGRNRSIAFNKSLIPTVKVMA